MNGVNAEIAKTLSTDELKLQVFKQIEGDYYKLEIAKTLSTDVKKIEALEGISNEYDKVEIITSLTTNELKLQEMSKIESQECKMRIAKSLTTDETKLEAIKQIRKEDDRTRIAIGMSTDEAKLTVIGQTKDEGDRLEIAYRLTTDDARLQALDTIERIDYKKVILREIDVDETKFNAIENIKNEDDKKVVLRDFRRNNQFDTDFIFNHLDGFIELEYSGEGIDKDALRRMYEKNNKILNTVDFRILEEKYLRLLGEDKINLITCYTESQDQLLSLNDKQLDIFSKCINNYLEKNNTEEWQVLANEVLNNISEYEELLDSIENVEDLSPEKLENLSRVLQNSNWVEITNMEQVEKYDEIIRQKCDEIINDENASLYDKRQAVIQKIFGHDLKYTQSILERFGQDNEKINDGEMKDYVRCLQDIVELDDIEVLEEIYNNNESVKMNKIYMERCLKQEYCKKYIEDLYTPKEEEKEEHEGVTLYNAGTDFKMIITAVGAYSGVNPENYKKDWNRPAIASQQVCTSYIRNDMLGTAHIKNVCYGFSNLKPDSLMLSGARDMYSSWGDSLVVTADHAEKYYTPDEQINHTRSYNEMNFRRIQEGQKMQPDYIVVFKENGELLNFEEVKKASEQWGKMPIVVIDKDACLEAERQKINDMLEEYQNNPSQELAKQINQKVKNNRVTDKSFGEDLMEKLPKVNKKDKEKTESEKTEEKVKKETKEIGLTDLEENYKGVNANERKQESKKIKQVYLKIQEIMKGENGDEREE